MGKFEKANRPQVRAAAPQPAPARRKPRRKKSRAPLIVCIIVAIVLVAGTLAGCLLLKGRDDGRIAQNVFVEGIDLSGMTEEEAKTALSALKFDNDMDVSLYTRGDKFKTYTTTYDPTKETKKDIYGKPLENAQATVAIVKDDKQPVDPDAPVDENGTPCTLDRTLKLLAGDVNAALDVDAAVKEAYQYGRTALKNGTNERVDIDVSKHLTLNESYIREVLASYLEDTASEGSETKIADGKTTVTDADGNPQTVDAIEITLGTLQRDIDIDALYDEIVAAYTKGEYTLKYVYQEKLPEAVDLDELYKKYKCEAPVNAVCDEDTFEITDGKDGFGFRMADAINAFEEALPGEKITLPLQTLKPEFTRESLEKQLFCDVLSYYDSPHTYNPTRTHNLELACEAIDGTIVKPGETFSFNETVGERTAAKGYGEAGVYVGGETQQQLGGGVCQVASTVFYCTIKANLEVVERYEHQFTPEYIPWGMDATVYWGYLDYKFRNNTAFPIRLEASVSNGYVHMRFVGTETKEYTVELDYTTTGYYEASVETVDISPDMPNYSKYSKYSEGDVIQTAYNGADVTTYMYKYDKNGKLMSTEIVCYSKYDRRNRLIAHIVKKEEPTTEPSTQPSTPEPTEPPTEVPTEAPTPEPTEPPTEETAPETP